jgi:hypothetical protein
MSSISNVLKEATIVGLSVVVMGFIVRQLMRYTPLHIKRDHEIEKKREHWNKYYKGEVSLFLIGFFLHFIFEYTKLNKYYCKEGNACKE